MTTIIAQNQGSNNPEALQGKHFGHFEITEYIDFDRSGRAQCPACMNEGKSKKNLSLVPGTTGAYKCFRGHTPQDIRAALGNTKPTFSPVTATQRKPPQAISLEKVQAGTRQLITGQNALPWLEKRGITDEMVDYFHLTAARAKVDDQMHPAIAIPIPSDTEGFFYLKKRIAPWNPAYDGPKWHQTGLTPSVWFTHRPTGAQILWLTEGEWDAILLGWQLRNQQEIAVGTLTHGAKTVPNDLRLQTADFYRVISWYDLDKAGEEGSQKLHTALGDRHLAATVPHPPNPPIGWDCSDALNSGNFTISDFYTAALAATAPPEPPPERNPLLDRIVTHAQLVATAPDYTDWLVPDLITSDELFLLAAPPRAGKSLLAMGLAKAVASGGRFLDRPVSQGGVLYVKLEDSDTKIKERAIAQEWAEDLPVFWLDKFKLEEIHLLPEICAQLDIRLFIIDTLSRAKTGNVAENSAEMAQLIEPLQDLCREQGVAGLLIHHTGKQTIGGGSGEGATSKFDPFDTVRGSSAIRATCRGAIVLAPSDQCYRLCVENGWGKYDLNVRLDAHTLTWNLLGNWQPPHVDLTQREQVLQELTKLGTVTVEQLFQSLNIPRRNIYEVLKRLQSEGLVTKHGSRRSAHYVRPGIQQIQQLNSLLNSPNPDPASVLGVIQQNDPNPGSTGSIGSIGSAGSIQNTENPATAYPPTRPKSLNAPVDPIDPVDPVDPQKTVELLNNSQNPDPARVSAIQQQFNNNSTSGSTGSTRSVSWVINPPERLRGIPLEILGEDEDTGFLLARPQGTTEDPCLVAPHWLGTQSTPPAPPAPPAPPLAVGDRVRFIGANPPNIKGLDDMTIDAIEGETATVSSPAWAVKKKFPLADLA